MNDKFKIEYTDNNGKTHLLRVTNHINDQNFIYDIDGYEFTTNSLGDISFFIDNLPNLEKINTDVIYYDKELLNKENQSLVKNLKKRTLVYSIDENNMYIAEGKILSKKHFLDLYDYNHEIFEVINELNDIEGVLFSEVKTENYNYTKIKTNVAIAQRPLLEKLENMFKELEPINLVKIKMERGHLPVGYNLSIIKKSESHHIDEKNNIESITHNLDNIRMNMGDIYKIYPELKEDKFYMFQESITNSDRTDINDLSNDIVEEDFSG